jgi:Na+/H+-dicarboxylate symporter
MFIFLGHAFGIDLPLGTVLSFTLSILLLSFATPGIPGGNPGFSPLPLFVAAGIPIQGPLVLDALDAIPDLFKTLLNVTADLSAATILTAPAAGAVSEFGAETAGSIAAVE